MLLRGSSFRDTPAGDRHVCALSALPLKVRHSWHFPLPVLGPQDFIGIQTPSCGLQGRARLCCWRQDDHLHFFPRFGHLYHLLPPSSRALERLIFSIVLSGWLVSDGFLLHQHHVMGGRQIIKMALRLPPRTLGRERDDGQKIPRVYGRQGWCMLGRSTAML